MSNMRKENELELSRFGEYLLKDVGDRQNIRANLPGPHNIIAQKPQ